MENLTHSLIGATLAELALPDVATPAQRRLFFVTGLVASNLPDADLFYTRISPAPLGSLLHHRGHTHTLGGIVALGIVMGLVSLLPSIRRHTSGLRVRFWALIAAGLLSHLVLDSWNSYGVHPFWPFDVRWIYGDAIYIVEPSLWMLLGVAAVLNTRNGRGAIAFGTLLVGLTVVAAWMRIIPVASLVALIIGAAALILVTRGWAPRTRSALALTLTAIFVASMFGLRERVHGRVLAALPVPASAHVIDVVLNSQPANPLCWSALAIVRDEQAGEYVMTRGTVSAIGRAGCGSPRAAPVQWEEPLHQSLATLRERYHRDCWLRAWMQFGRAPQLDDRAIVDRRFGGKGNFTTMDLRPLADAAICPRNIPHWATPRADLVPAAAN